MAATLSRTRLWLLLPLLSGCAGVPTRVESHAPPRQARGIVLVANGAGGYQTAPRSLIAAVERLGLPLHVRSFDWTHGLGVGLADLLDVTYSRCQGRRLAEEVCRLHAIHPDIPVSLVGYSAGSAVVLAAAESLPPGSLERIVLLAPAVSSSYDLRRALLAARSGLDLFYSDRDRVYLGLGTALAGTADGSREAPAGRVGFHPPLLPPAELALYRGLRQHPWTPSVAWTGNNGGHAGSLSQTYMEKFVLPLLAP